MIIARDDIEKVYINELGRIVIVLREDYKENGERARFARRIMADRVTLQPDVELEPIIELDDEEE